MRPAEEGADIIGIDVCADIGTVPYPLGSAEEMEETADLIKKLGRRALMRRADVHVYGELGDAVAEGLTEFGPIVLPVDIFQPRVISDAVLFLASDLARYITGVTLPVDAGFMVK